MIADVNECLEFPCSIHFVCNNTVGSYMCYCDEGFALVGDKCEGITKYYFEIYHKKMKEVFTYIHVIIMNKFSYSCILYFIPS